MEEKKLKNGKENETSQKTGQAQKVDKGVLELIEDSLGDVSGGNLGFGGGTNIDNYDHWHKS